MSAPNTKDQKCMRSSFFSVMAVRDLRSLMFHWLWSADKCAWAPWLTKGAI